MRERREAVVRSVYCMVNALFVGACEGRMSRVSNVGVRSEMREWNAG